MKELDSLLKEAQTLLDQNNDESLNEAESIYWEALALFETDLAGLKQSGRKSYAEYAFKIVDGLMNVAKKLHLDLETDPRLEMILEEVESARELIDNSQPASREDAEGNTYLKTHLEAKEASFKTSQKKQKAKEKKVEVVRNETNWGDWYRSQSKYFTEEWGLPAGMLDESIAGALDYLEPLLTSSTPEEGNAKIRAQFQKDYEASAVSTLVNGAAFVIEGVQDPKKAQAQIEATQEYQEVQEWYKLIKTSDSQNQAQALEFIAYTLINEGPLAEGITGKINQTQEEVAKKRGFMGDPRLILLETAIRVGASPYMKVAEQDEELKALLKGDESARERLSKLRDETLNTDRLLKAAGNAGEEVFEAVVLARVAPFLGKLSKIKLAAIAVSTYPAYEAAQAKAAGKEESSWDLKRFTAYASTIFMLAAMGRTSLKKSSEPASANAQASGSKPKGLNASKDSKPNALVPTGQRSLVRPGAQTQGGKPGPGGDISKGMALANMGPQDLAPTDGSPDVNGPTGPQGPEAQPDRDDDKEDDEITRLARAILDVQHRDELDFVDGASIRNTFLDRQLVPHCHDGNSNWLLRLATKMSELAGYEDLTFLGTHILSRKEVHIDRPNTFDRNPPLKALLLMLPYINPSDKAQLKETLLVDYQKNLGKKYFLSNLYLLIKDSGLTLSQDQVDFLLKRAVDLKSQDLGQEENTLEMTLILKVLSKNIAKGSQYRIAKVVGLINELHCQSDQANPHFFTSEVIKDVSAWPQEHLASFCENLFPFILTGELSLDDNEGEEVISEYLELLTHLPAKSVQAILDPIFAYIKSSGTAYGQYTDVESLPLILSALLKNEDSDVSLQFCFALYTQTRLLDFEHQQSLGIDVVSTFPRWVKLVDEAESFIQLHLDQVRAYAKSQLELIADKPELSKSQYDHYVLFFKFLGQTIPDEIPAVLREVYGIGDRLNNLPLGLLPAQAFSLSSKVYAQAGLGPLGSYLFSGMPLQQDFWRDYLASHDQGTWIVGMEQNLQRLRSGQELKDSRFNTQQYAFASLDNAEELDYPTFLKEYPDKEIPHPFLNATFHLDIPAVASTHHLLNKGVFTKEAQRVLAWTKTESAKAALADFIFLNRSNLRPLREELTRIFKNKDIAKLSDSAFNKEVPQLLEAVYTAIQNGKKSPKMVELCGDLLLFQAFMALHRNKRKNTRISLKGISNKKINSDNLQAYAQRMKLFYEEVQTYAARQNINLNQLPSLNKRMRNTIKAYERYEAKKAEQSKQKEKVTFVPSKAPADKFFGYVGEDCTKDRGEAIYHPNFQVYRMVSQGRLVGMIYLYKQNLDGEEVLVMGIQPRSRWKVNYEKLLEGLRDPEGDFITAIRNAGFDYLLMSQDTGEQSNRDDMLSVIEDADFEPITFDEKIDKGLSSKEDVFTGNKFLKVWEKAG